jgi:hypothetical protein
MNSMKAFTASEIQAMESQITSLKEKCPQLADAAAAKASQSAKAGADAKAKPVSKTKGGQRDNRKSTITGVEENRKKKGQ